MVVHEHGVVSIQENRESRRRQQRHGGIRAQQPAVRRAQGRHALRIKQSDQSRRRAQHQENEDHAHQQRNVQDGLIGFERNRRVIAFQHELEREQPASANSSVAGTASRMAPPQRTSPLRVA